MNNLFLGGDVSKGYADFFLMNSSGEEMRNAFKLMDTKEGHSELNAILKANLNSSDDRIYCGVESTGGYENNWMNMLSSFSDERIKAVRINPIRIFHQSKANMDRTVTDKVASKTISIHLSEHYEELFQHPAPSTEMASHEESTI